MKNRSLSPVVARSARPCVTITSLVAALAAGVSGCGTTVARESGSAEISAAASVRIDSEATRGRFDPAYFEGQARRYGAPLDWAERAGSLVTAVEAQRATAEATRVRAAADHARSLAEANQLLAEAVSAFEMQRAAAGRLRAGAEAAYTAEEKRIAADERAYEAQVEAKVHEAQMKLEEALRRAEALRAAADEAYTRAEAEHERVLAAAAAYEDNTRVTIEQLRASAGSAVARAEAEAAALRVEAATRRSTGRAEAESHEAQIEASRAWVEVRTAELTREARAVREETASRVEGLRAEAEAIRGYELDEGYASAVASAETVHREMTARAAMLRENATAELAAAAATMTTDRKEVEARLEADGLTYEAELVRIASDTRVAEARAAIARSRAQELEHDARARFVSEVAGLMSGTSHAEKAHAFAWAQGLADEVGRSGGTLDAGSLTVDGPEVSAAIRALVAQLGEAKALRASAESERERAISSTIMRRSEIEVWWKESRAAAEAALEGIAHAEAEKVASLRQVFADADEIESQSNIAYAQAMEEAEAGRTDAQARLENLFRREEFEAERGRAREEMLLAQAAAAGEEHAERVARLERLRDAARAEADAAAEALEARASQVFAEGRAESERFAAMAAAGGASMEAELERRSAAATRMMTEAAIARGEAMTVAESVAAIASATRRQAVADLEAESAGAATGFARRRAEASGVRDAALAAAEATLARATAAYARFQSDDGSRRAEAEAVERALLAFVDEQHAVADAQDAAVFADFSARMAVLQSERDRAYADAYFQEFLAEAGLTVSDLRGYVESANAALARLREASVGSAARPVTATVSEEQSGGRGVPELRVESMSANGVASVSTDDE